MSQVSDSGPVLCLLLRCLLELESVLPCPPCLPALAPALTGALCQENDSTAEPCNWGLAQTLMC